MAVQQKRTIYLKEAPALMLDAMLRDDDNRYETPSSIIGDALIEYGEKYGYKVVVTPTRVERVAQ